MEQKVKCVGTKSKVPEQKVNICVIEKSLQGAIQAGTKSKLL
jgi:hypothetical protein